ncbi:MAG: dihydroorotase [Flavobacteriales bacterium]|nr:dihydroorotase [Flavobacteriales bacterium]
MKERTLIKNAKIINEGKIFTGDVLIENGIISKIAGTLIFSENIHTIDATGKYLLPGIIDTHVHFRQPGFTNKGDIETESRAAVAGGITSYFEMPNTNPNALTQFLLQQKFDYAASTSYANYSFFMGIDSNNLHTVVRTDLKNVCGISDDGVNFQISGNLISEKAEYLEQVFSECKGIFAIHSEDDATIEKNTDFIQKIFKEQIPIECHPLIRNEECCFIATKKAIALAEKHNTRLHILHLSTAKEAELFLNNIPLSEKKITTEVCIHHLWFCDDDYKTLGSKIKWNPAIKTKADKEGLWKALLDNRIDIIVTDHAPHTIEEKGRNYLKCPSGAPMVQHSLVAMLEFYHKEKITLEKIAEKMCHNPAILYKIINRGFIREGYFADLVLVDLNSPFTVCKENILYKFGWSPFEGQTFQSKITHTFVNGNLVYEKGNFSEFISGQRLTFLHE